MFLLKPIAGLSLIATLPGGSPRLLLIRESFITGIFGLIFLGSLLFPRPLLFQLVKTTVGDLALVDEFDIAKTIQQHQMTSADQRVLPALYWAHGPIIRRNRKWDKRIGAKQLLYLVHHWHP
jgi:hypothetical protein